MTVTFDKKCFIFAGAARRAGPDSMSILCLCVDLCKIISRPLIGQNSETPTPPTPTPHSAEAVARKGRASLPAKVGIPHFF